MAKSHQKQINQAKNDLCKQTNELSNDLNQLSIKVDRSSESNIAMAKDLKSAIAVVAGKQEDFQQRLARSQEKQAHFEE